MAALGPEDIILYADECGVKYAPTFTRCWALKGVQPLVPTEGGRKKQDLIGVVAPLEGTIHIEFTEGLSSYQFQDFLEKLLVIYADKRKIIVILDNHRAHHARALEPFLESVKEKLELVFLPPYSPELNPIERFWKFMRKQVTHNTFFATFEKLLDALRHFFQKFKLPSFEIKSLCRIS